MPKSVFFLFLFSYFGPDARNPHSSRRAGSQIGPQTSGLSRWSRCGRSLRTTMRTAFAQPEGANAIQASSPHIQVRRPTIEPFFVKKYRDFEASSLGVLVFRGTFRPNFDLLWPILTCFDPFRRQTSPIPTYSPGGPDLFSPIATYFVSQ